MYYAYVIRSVRFDFLYKGHCEDLDARLKQHNYGMTKSIKKYAPFVLAYFRVITLKTAARRRFLKSVLQTKVSLLLTALSVPFGVMGWILRHSSSSAVEIFTLAVLTFVICFPLIIIWYRTWKDRIKDAAAV
jgi:putative endonuclease